MISSVLCRRCNTVKPMTAFYKDKTTKSGYGQPCKTCKNAERSNHRVTRRALRMAAHACATGLMTCSQCQQTKPLEAFPASKTSLAGHTNPCKACKNHNTREATSVRRQARGLLPVVPVVGATTRRCACCLAEKPLDAFSKRPTPANPCNLHSRCKLCEALRSKAYRDRDPVAYRALSRQRAQIRRAADPEGARLKSLQWYQSNPEKAAARSTRWRKKNPGKRVAFQQRRKARQLSLPDTFTPDDRRYMLQYWGFACAVCGRQEGFDWMLADDHWIPFRSPACPGTVALNMLPLCHSKGPGAMGCNNLKHNFDPHAWLVERFGTRKAATIERRIAAYFAGVAARAAS